jgi:probable rRNA maturation factor
MITIEPPSTISIPALSRSGLTSFLNRARLAAGLPGEVEVLLTGDAELKRLNKSFRGKNKPTDVLSFPTPAEIAQHHAGDLAISLETAARQAAAYGHTLRDEVRILLLHGLLHLAGEDHETDNGEMALREAALRRELKLPATLIERTTEAKQIPARTGKKTSSRPKAALHAAEAERPLYFAKASANPDTSHSSSRTRNRITTKSRPASGPGRAK